MRDLRARGRLIAAALVLGAQATLLGSACAPPEDSARRSAEAIIGGSETLAYPAVLLVLGQVPGSRQATLCTGSQISPHLVLTAAHCLDPHLIGETAQLSLYPGPRIDGVSRAALLSTTARHLHPDFRFDQVGSGGDLGLLVLAEARDETPLSLRRDPLSADLIGHAATLVGYGKNDGADVGSLSAGTKREVQTRLGGYTDTLVRFGGPGETACEGDSGGPGLVTLGGRSLVVGVVSYGAPACDRESFDTRVDAYLDWIDGHLEREDPGFLASQGITPRPAGGCALGGRAPIGAGPGLLALIALLFARRRRLSS